MNKADRARLPLTYTTAPFVEGPRDGDGPPDEETSNISL